jgi:hypothetical protein
MNSEERPATGRTAYYADQQHTVPARPVKAHFACFRQEQPPFSTRQKVHDKTQPLPVEYLLRRAAATAKNRQPSLSRRSAFGHSLYFFTRLNQLFTNSSSC